METKTCRRCNIEKDIKEFRKLNGEVKIRNRNFCRSCENNRSLNYYYETRKTNDGWERIDRGKKRSQYKLRLDIIKAYGQKCQCCSETNPFFLSIDHINDDGYIERKSGKYSSGGFYRWLKKSGYPKSNYQLLCFNCNRSKTIFGYCAHKIDNFDINVLYPLKNGK